MKSKKFTPKKNTAQAMVEFAIVLPILLLLLYGLLEAGRLLFMYSTIVTASRQAARYGSTTGDGSTAGVARYRDCFGIRLAANRVDYLNAFDHTTDDILISWDTGPGTTATPICPVGLASDTWTPPSPPDAPSNSSRIIVTIKGDFNPIVRLVPFMARTVANGNPIEATSARTILTSVSINVPNPAAITTDTDLQLSPHRESPPFPAGEPHSRLGEVVTATVTVNAASGTPTGTVEVRATETSTGTTVTICTLAYSGSTITCDIDFNSLGTFLVVAYYTPNTTAFSPSSGNELQVVGKASTTTTITGPGWSLAGENVTFHVTVSSIFGTPTGTVEVTSDGGNCTVTLVSGEGDCVLNFSNVGDNWPVVAVYSGDTEHLPSNDTTYHDVLSVPATITNTPPPTNTPAPTNTVPPTTPTFTPTVAPTPVSGCSNIQVPAGQTIELAGKTMYLNIYNPMTYDVTIKDIFLRWNYLQGFNGKALHLVSAQLDSTLGTNVFWTGDVHAPSYSPPLSTTVIIPANSTSQIIFTFDKLYTRSDGEQIQISFSTPGCEDHTINVVKPK